MPKQDELIGMFLRLKNPIIVNLYVSPYLIFIFFLTMYVYLMSERSLESQIGTIQKQTYWS